MKHAKLLAALLFLSVVGNFTTAHAQAWDTDIVSWTGPAACADGSALSFCPVSGYRVQVATTSTGTFSDVPGDVTVTTKTIAAVTPGQHCYRVVVLSVNGNAAPSGVACTLTIKPTPVPGPATGLTVDNPIAFNVVPNFKTFAFDRGSRSGTVKKGASCDETRTTGNGYFAVARLNMVSPRPQPGTVVVAHCSATAAS